MTLDSQTIRSQSHTAVGSHLERGVDVVIERWSRRAVEEQPNAQRVHHAVLLNHLREFLQSLGRSLAESQDPHNNQHCRTAVNHGEQRWETGWSLAEVVRDYQILRLVIVDFLLEALERPLEYREVQAVGLALDEAIGASVAMYVKSRDEHLRGLEDQRADEANKVEQRLRDHAAVLLDADRRKNEFLAILAHELRNPLAPVRNAVQIMKLKGPPDPELSWARDVIERQLQQMTRMVDDLLDISRVTRGLVKLEKERVDVSTVVARAVETARPLIDGRKQALTVSLPNVAVWLDADPARLAQVLSNLLTNAAKYTEKGGQIWLSAEQQAGEVHIKVRDTGIGIPDELMPHIFELFTQEDRSSERTQGGLGIGLALVRRLVELHGGRVEAYSAGRGQGSEFVVRLEMGEGHAPAPARPLASDVPARALRILVVDDNVDSAESLAVLLRISGHEVRTAYNGPTALEAARTWTPEAVLLDIGLPGMDGLEVARRLRQDAGLKDAMLVALTGFGHEDDRRRSREAGCNTHMLKPVDLRALTLLLSHVQRAESVSEVRGS